MRKASWDGEATSLSQVFGLALIWPIVILIYENIKKPLAGRLNELCVQFIVLYIGALVLELIQFAFTRLLKRRKLEQAEADTAAQAERKEISFVESSVQALIFAMPLFAKLILLDLAKDWLKGKAISITQSDVKFAAIGFAVIFLFAAIHFWLREDHEANESDCKAKEEGEGDP